MPKQELLIKHQLLPFSDVAQAVWYVNNICIYMLCLLVCVISSGNLLMFALSMEKHQVN